MAFLATLPGLLPAATGADAEERAVDAIRLAARLDDPKEPRPLPLVSSWSYAGWPTSFSPAFAVEQIRAGGYVLPWFAVGVPPADETRDEYAEQRDYFGAPLEYVARRHLPLAFTSTQWEVLLTRDAPGPLSPDGPLEPWEAAGRRWAERPLFKRLQEIYPDPPLVEFVSNNEQGRMSQSDLGLRPDDPSAAAIARRRALGDRWIARYRALERGFRAGLTAPAWRAHALFVGYDAWTPAALGRWSGWPAYSLRVPGRAEPWPYAWDGASPSYYVHNWAPDSDFTVWSPEIETMNYVHVLAEVRRTEPRFWFELSVWDGQVPGDDSDKRAFYFKRGQEWTPERYAGFAQFGLWLLRPRVLREFRGVDDDRIRFGAYFQALLAAVARVHEEPLLRDFWQHGRLVENRDGAHPYQAALTAELAAAPRWFLLDTPANPARPWSLDTPLALFSLALVRGTLPHREWLVYTFSPSSARMQATVKIPAGPTALVSATRSGCFTLVNEAGAAVRQIGC